MGDVTIAPASAEVKTQKPRGPPNHLVRNIEKKDFFEVDTGWSKETVTYNFSLTDLKIKKNGQNQWFLASLHREVLIFWCLKRFRLKIILPSSVVHKWCDGVWERFRGVRRVSVGRLRVSEDVLQCLLVSLVSGVVLGVIGGVLWFIWMVMKEGLSCLEVFRDFCDSSVMWYLFRLEPTPHFGPTLKGEIFSPESA